MWFIKHSPAVSCLHICETSTPHQCHKYVLVQCCKFRIPVRKPVKDKGSSPFLRNSLDCHCWTLKEVHAPNHSEMWIHFGGEGSVPLYMWLGIILFPVSLTEVQQWQVFKKPKIFLQTINIFKKGWAAPCPALVECLWHGLGTSVTVGCTIPTFKEVVDSASLLIWGGLMLVLLLFGCLFCFLFWF